MFRFSDQKISVSRATLYQTSSSESENDDVSDTNLYTGEQFDFVEVDATGNKDSEGDADATVAKTSEPEFELFPLFSTDKLTEVDLRCSEGETSIAMLTRPDTYYFAQYSPSEKLRFAEAALSYDDIVKSGQETPYRRFREHVLNVNEYNAKLDRTKLRLERAKRRRPGKKQRVARKLAKENILRRSLPPTFVPGRKKTRRGGKKKRRIAATVTDEA